MRRSARDGFADGRQSMKIVAMTGSLRTASSNTSLLLKNLLDWLVSGKPAAADTSIAAAAVHIAGRRV
ncbi:MAG: hypothetical protein ACXW29_07570 [Thermoanaerobaculia bacterium]